MAGMNPYDLNPPRTNGGNANPFGTQSVMPQSNMPVSGTTTSSFSTLQNVQEGPTGAGLNVMGVPPQTQTQAQMQTQTQPGLLASQMRSRASMAAPAVQRGMGATSMQMQPSMQKQPQQGRQAGQASAMVMQPTTY